MKMTECTVCEGDGYTVAPETCTECNGTGRVTTSSMTNEEIASMLVGMADEEPIDLIMRICLWGDEEWSQCDPDPTARLLTESDRFEIIGMIAHGFATLEEAPKPRTVKRVIGRKLVEEPINRHGDMPWPSRG